MPSMSVRCVTVCVCVCVCDCVCVCVCVCVVYSISLFVCVCFSQVVFICYYQPWAAEALHLAPPTPPSHGEITRDYWGLLKNTGDY